MKDKLTPIECAALEKVLSSTGMDCWAQLQGDATSNWIRDTENCVNLNLAEGLSEIEEGIAYPGEHEGLTPEESNALADLLIEFKLVSVSWKKWFKENK